MYPTRRAQFQVGLGAALISFSAVFVRLSDVGPTMGAFYRVFFGGVCLLIIALVRRQSFWRGFTPLFYIVVSGCALSIDLIFWHRSITYIGPGLATIIGNLQVFILAFAGVFVFKERVSWQFILAIPLACVGMYYLVGFKWGYLSPAFL